MAEEVIIQVTTETDAAQLEELDSLVEEIREKATIDASVEVEDTSLDEASDKATTLEEELNTIDSTVATPEVDTSSLDEASSKAEETASSMDSITTAAAGLAATAGVEQMVTTADNINTSWNRLQLTFANTGVSMDTLKSQANSLSASTGRSGGTIRNYFNQMGIAGVTNTDLLTSSFEALAGKAYQTGNSIETMESGMQRMAMTGNASGRMLKNLGITTNDLAKAMGVSADEVSEAFKNMTPEERIAAITKAMGDGAQANEMYKNSYAGLKERADAAMAGLMGAVGQAILPVVIPALQAATNAIKFLTDGFKNLPGPVQSIIGAVGGFIAVGTAAVGVMGVIGNVVGSVVSGFRSLKEAANLVGLAGKLSPLKDALVTVASTAKTAALELLTAGKNALLAGANAVKSAAMWAIENGVKILSTGASYALAAAQAILNAIMSANPIMLVVIAIAALVAALIWAYNNVDWFRQMVDNAWQTLVSFGQQIYTVVAGALQWLGDLFNQFTSQLGLNTNDWMQALLGFILFLPTLPLQVGIALINTIARLLGFKGNFVQTMATTAAQAITNFVTWISQLPGRVGNYLSNVIGRVHSFASSLVSSFISAASSAVSNFVGQISSLPGQLSNELSNMLSLVNDWAATLPAKFWEAGVNAVKNFLNALGIHSPGTMQTMMLWEVSEMARRVPKEGENLVGNISSLGSDVVDSFQPSLGIDWDDTMNADIDGGAGGSIGASQVNNFYFNDVVVDNEERMQRIVDYVRREIHWNNKTAGRTI